MLGEGDSDGGPLVSAFAFTFDIAFDVNSRLSAFVHRSRVLDIILMLLCCFISCVSCGVLRSPDAIYSGCMNYNSCKGFWRRMENLKWLYQVDFENSFLADICVIFVITTTTKKTCYRANTRVTVSFEFNTR